VTAGVERGMPRTSEARVVIGVLERDGNGTLLASIIILFKLLARNPGTASWETPCLLDLTVRFGR
jgi:hypothetical protein